MAKGSSGKAVRSDAMGAKPGTRDGVKRHPAGQVLGGGRGAMHPSAMKKGSK